MEGSKWWLVTYTKHIKQKRKVYHDGVLKLQTISNKVMLYDDCEKLLSSRFLNKNEVVITGESLTLDHFLVDVGDVEKDHNMPISEIISFQGNDNESNINTVQCFSVIQNDVAKKRSKVSHQNVSNQVMRVIQNDVAKKRSKVPDQNVSNQVIREWNVLYTSQIMKKAKTYHDGILRLAVRGNQSKQVILYDIDRNQLDTNYINKAEIVEPCQSFKFDGHLVEIGEPLEVSNFVDGLNNIYKNCMKEFVEVPKSSKTIKTGPQHAARKDGSMNSYLNPDENKVDSDIHFMNPVRSVHQILRSLKKPADMGTTSHGVADDNFIRHDASECTYRVEKFVEPEHFLIEPRFETLSQSTGAMDDNGDLDSANKIATNMRTASCAYDKDIDPVAAIRGTSLKSVNPRFGDTFLEGKGDCYKTDDDADMGDCPSFDLLV